MAFKKGGLGRGLGGVVDLLRRVQPHDLHEPVHGVASVDGRDQALRHGEIRQAVDALGCGGLHGQTPLLDSLFSFIIRKNRLRVNGLMPISPVIFAGHLANGAKMVYNR